MTHITAHRQFIYRILPQTRAVRRWLETLLEDQRQLYNAALEERISCYRTTGKGRSYFDQCRSLTQCRQMSAKMRDCPLQIQRGTLKRLEQAFRQFFQRGNIGFPCFKGRRSWTSLSVTEKVKVRGNTLHILGYRGLTIRRKGGILYTHATPLSATWKCVGLHWYATVCYEMNIPAPIDNGHVIGLDHNVGQVADSDEIIHSQPTDRHLEGKIKRLQRRAARQTPKSHRRRKTIQRTARAKRKQANIRRNWQHHVSRNLATRAGTIVMEWLQTQGMTASAKGTVETPGTPVQAKADLNREIQKTGWGALEQILQYKAAHVIAVPPAYTSHTCHVCGKVDCRSRRSRVPFRCVSYGHAEQADIDAEQNIKASGMGASAREGAIVIIHPNEP